MLAVGIVFAVAIGVALGLLGGGGSILTVPILRYVLGLPAHAAIAGSLFVVAVTSAVALVGHARAGRVRWRTGVLFGAAGMLGAYAAGRVAHWIPAPLLLLAFAAMMVATAAAMLRARPAPPRRTRAELPTLEVLVEGLVVGGVTGLVGAGGGFLVVPALVVLGGLPMPVAVGTSLLVIAMKSSAGLAGYLASTPIPWPPVLLVTAAALVGSTMGLRLAARVDELRLRRGFGWFVLAMAAVVLWQELPPLLRAL
ncbi:MAG: sulfite exporter TauE/SafE family protein [Nannocystaceae bacterium]|nr:sulfite exporter TauE/SafE family protein [Nannocystaceae bacterium]